MIPRPSHWPVAAFIILLGWGLASDSAWSQDARPQLRLDETARIGVYDEDPDYMFGRIDHVVIAPDHSVLVVDGQLELVRRYTRSGEFVANVGRKGEGPGEYERIRGMVALPDGRIAILSNPRKLTFVDALTGEYLDAIQVPTGLHAARLLTHDIDGHVYVKAIAEVETTDEEWQMLWRKLDSAGEVLEEIEIPKSNYVGNPIVSSRRDGMRTNFIEETASAWSPLGYLVIGRNDTYSFELRRPDGTIKVTREYAPIRLTPGERAEWEAFVRRMSEQFGKTFAVPEVKPPYFSIEVDRHGRVWVQRYVEAAELSLVDEGGEPYTVWREPNSYDVFTPDGKFIGAVTLPAKARLVAKFEDVIWGVQRTDDGEQLVRWKVQGMPVGPHP